MLQYRSGLDLSNGRSQWKTGVSQYQREHGLIARISSTRDTLKFLSLVLMGETASMSNGLLRVIGDTTQAEGRKIIRPFLNGGQGLWQVSPRRRSNASERKTCKASCSSFNFKPVSSHIEPGFLFKEKALQIICRFAALSNNNLYYFPTFLRPS